MTTSPSPGLTKPQTVEIQKLRLNSPILHIGSEVQRLNPFEYIQTSNRVYLPNSETLSKALLQRGYLNDYISRVERREGIANLLEDALGDDWQKAKDSDGEPIFPKTAISRKWPDEQITDLRPMIRNGLGEFYIPGSSIKGAIRTAIAYYLLRHSERYNVPKAKRLSTIEETLQRRLGGRELSKFQQKFLDDDLFMNSLFTDFNLRYQDRPVRARMGPNTDFMRAIKVSDSEPLLECKITNKKGKEITYNIPVVAEVLVSSRFDNYNAKYRASIYAEMVRNVRTTFTISLDTEMLSWFSHDKGMQLPFKTIDDIVKICSEFAQEQWDFEHDYWNAIKNNPNAAGRNLDFSEIRRFYEPENCPYALRIGWGTGMRGTTINLNLPDELVQNIRDNCGIAAPGFEAPKSRRTVYNPNGIIKYLPGWVKFKELKN
ncbi:type III-A CRISPR-associated RAMP protein Csm5 [Oxynema sp. CENA135]|uniref:type III-A CRISPR-associated RAMP protein Csm5 n=1 Tax=Oxynema sp. CENA135 TaxID=984206 RepID=UPI00190C9D8A|nr:type III-A CRISPR-associated RAMP protein Csm5 [Oxynema sp. CENA135]MBK4730299.1 type III-A CRISPR-associated RAMP protein Csm5 [Oxynema sp. CENA135]